MPALDKIVIVDFGSQYTQLIARRIREMRVFTEILPPSSSCVEMTQGARGVILSGGPASTHDGSIPFDMRLFEKEIPILGICYGMQLMNISQNGSVKPLEKGEYGKQRIALTHRDGILSGLEREETVWMSHGDSVETLGACYTPIARSRDGIVAAFRHQTKPHFGVQFHPEVSHTEKGEKILGNFLDICCCSRDWSIEHYVQSAVEEIRKKVGSGRVVSLVSGGVDSTAATFLCYEALGPKNVFPLHIDTGLMREGESRQVVELLHKGGIRNIVFVDASRDFLHALQGVVEPESKRKIIGNLFIDILDREIAKLEDRSRTTFFCQGTLYTDLIESGKGCGKHAAVIKSHHNVNAPVVEEKRKQGLIVEPNARIFKDEVRRLCKALGVPKPLIGRHPFPGPGLAIRILGEVTPQRIQTLRRADAIYLEEIVRAGLYDTIWQAFAVLLPISAVGVMGDKRTVGNVVALRAVSSSDGMTADFYLMPMELLGRVCTRIVNEVPGVNRVVYDVTSKPPGTIEWE